MQPAQICFWTDRRSGEHDIFAPLKHETLVIDTINGASLSISMVAIGGRTRQFLQAEARRIAPLTSPAPIHPLDRLSVPP